MPRWQCPASTRSGFRFLAFPFLLYLILALQPHLPSLRDVVRYRLIPQSCQFRDKVSHQIVATVAQVRRRLYAFSGRAVGSSETANLVKRPSAPNKSEKSTQVDLLHRRLGHPSLGVMLGMEKGGLTGKIHRDDIKEWAKTPCEICIRGKQAATPLLRDEPTKAKKALDFVVSDVCGPMPVESKGGARYLLVVVDRYSRFMWTFPLRRKSDVEGQLEEWLEMIQNSTERRVKTLRTDNGGEFTSTTLERYLRKKGIAHQYTVPETPAQNGQAKRANRTLDNRIACLLLDSDLPPSLWAEAAMTAAFQYNRTPLSAIDHRTPYEF
ncbi:hypothetical protein JCM11641_001681 [Rhodosporidiobolus odoratus]